VWDLEVRGGVVYVCGEFTSIGGQSRSRLAALSVADGSASAWDPSADNTVYMVAESGGTVYVGGRLTSIGGQPRAYLAALDAGTGAATAWNPNPAGPFPSVSALP
jgi:hypothetical protein